MIENKSKITYNDGVYPYPYPCIYKLIFGDEFYIGQTINLDNRVRQHEISLRKGNAANKLQKAYEENNHSFCVDIVEAISPEKDKIYLNQREFYHIKKLKPTLNGDWGSCGVTSREWVRPGDNRLEPIRKDLLMSNAEAVKKHHAKLDEFKIRPYIEEGKKIRQYAEATKQSVQGLFLDAVREYMKNHPK